MSRRLPFGDDEADDILLFAEFQVLAPGEVRHLVIVAGHAGNVDERQQFVNTAPL